jgi:hypothetical protein
LAAPTQLDRIEGKLDAVLLMLTTIIHTGGKTMSALSDLQDQVTANENLEESAVQLIVGLASQIASASTDPVALAKLTASLAATANDLAKAITANTPAAPPVPAPAPAPST